MRPSIVGRTEQRPKGYPAFVCSRCRALWHIGQAARWDSGVITDAVEAAKQRGWRLSNQGHQCPECVKQPQPGGEK